MNGGVQPIDWLAITPPLALALGAIAVLMADGFLVRWRAWSPSGLSVAAILVAGVAVAVLAGDARDVFCVELSSAGAPVVCSYAVDTVSIAVWVVVLVGTLVVTLLSSSGAIDARVPLPEHHFLLLCSASGAMALAASRDLITLLISLEVVSLPAFAMAGLKRGDRRSAEAALKFFLVSVVSAAVMLLGISFVYGATGAVHLESVRAALDAGVDAEPVAVAGVMLTLVGLGFKVAAVPFHAWVPDVYVGAPVPVAAYLSVVSKAAGFVGLIIVLGLGFTPYSWAWGPAVGVLAALTMTVGNVLALRQRNAVRLLAWSSVAQSGFILAPLAVVGEVGDLAVRASLGYLLIYAVVNLGAFAVVAMMVRDRPAGQLADYAGLLRREPWAGVGLAFALLCLAGLPPGVIGLFAKLVAFQAVVEGGMGWLVAVMAANVAIGLAYYLRWTVVILSPSGEEEARPVVHPAVGAAVGGTLTLAVGLSLLPAAVFNVLG
ncbi:MAG: NADH-quinone oxidoreductase subunit N [Propionibacteriales bacterium]|nr:NADH-quinone oxidoreductase subunit N [Propionibacteriales bacterium]